MVELLHARRLEVLNAAVAVQFRGQRQCIAAVASLVVAGTELGYSIQPQPVSLWTRAPSGRQSVTGRIATDFATAQHTGPVTDSREPNAALWYREVGHMAAICTDHCILMDPTYEQFSHIGVPERPVLLMLPGEPPDSGANWCRSEIDRDICYWPVTDVSGWEDDYRISLSEVAPVVVPRILELVQIEYDRLGISRG